MANESGDRTAKQPANTSESSKLVLPSGETVESVPLQVGSFSIDDAIGMHLIDCTQCRNTIESQRPAGLGKKSGHCDTYWQLQLMRAQYEGKRNNFVAYTELGDEARKEGTLE
jgi:hypothetical protein